MAQVVIMLLRTERRGWQIPFIPMMMKFLTFTQDTIVELGILTYSKLWLVVPRSAHVTLKATSTCDVYNATASTTRHMALDIKILSWQCCVGAARSLTFLTLDFPSCLGVCL
jgi:hypothetical protein